MSNLLVKVWDVNHGTCISLQTPNGRKAVFDCGSSDELHPAREINPTSEKKKLDYMVITHPHKDHIQDLEEFDSRFKIKVLSRNKNITKEVLRDDDPGAFDPNSKTMNNYFTVSKRFTQDVKPENDPENSDWGKECTIHTFHNSGTELEVNDLSIASFVVFGNETILYGGDLKEKGWLELLKRKSFRDYLEKTTILIASHHGNDSGYCKEIFNYFKPRIIIFSAGSYQDFAITKYESQIDNPMTIRKRSGGTEDRKVITTRNDGNIELVIYPDGATEPKITIN